MHLIRSSGGAKETEGNNIQVGIEPLRLHIAVTLPALYNRLCREKSIFKNRCDGARRRKRQQPDRNISDRPISRKHAQGVLGTVAVRWRASGEQKKIPVVGDGRWRAGRGRRAVRVFDIPLFRT